MELITVSLGDVKLQPPFTNGTRWGSWCLNTKMPVTLDFYGAGYNGEYGIKLSSLPTSRRLHQWLYHIGRKRGAWTSEHIGDFVRAICDLSAHGYTVRGNLRRIPLESPYQPNPGNLK